MQYDAGGDLYYISCCHGTAWINLFNELNINRFEWVTINRYELGIKGIWDRAFWDWPSDFVAHIVAYLIRYSDMMNEIH